jgi:hypothetical protein
VATTCMPYQVKLSRMAADVVSYPRRIRLWLSDAEAVGVTFGCQPVQFDQLNRRGRDARSGYCRMHTGGEEDLYLG